jgi:hypothetical protein
MLAISARRWSWGSSRVTSNRQPGLEAAVTERCACEIIERELYTGVDSNNNNGFRNLEVYYYYCWQNVGVKPGAFVWSSILTVANLFQVINAPLTRMTVLLCLNLIISSPSICWRPHIVLSSNDTVSWRMCSSLPSLLVDWILFTRSDLLGYG